MSQKIDRINSELQKELSIIIKDEINDPRLEKSIISILDVDTSNDLSFAKVSISIYNADKQEVLAALIKGRGYIRKCLSSRVKMRVIPQLVFLLDEGIEHSEKINKIIKDLDIPEEEDDSKNS